MQLRLTPNPSYKLIMKGDSYNDVQSAQYVCPVSGLEMSGIYRFAFLRSCGCVFAEKALKEVRSENCHLVGECLVFVCVILECVNFLIGALFLDLLCIFLSFPLLCSVGSHSPQRMLSLSMVRTMIWKDKEVRWRRGGKLSD